MAYTTPIRHDEPLLDWDLSVRLAGDSSSLAEELFMMLMRELQPQHEAVLSAWGTRDLERLWDAAHLLRGSTAYCGVPALKHAAQLLEEAIETGEPLLIEPEIEQLGSVVAAMLQAHAEGRR